MTPEQLQLLLEYIDAKIDEFAARDSSDGGLAESINTFKIKDLLFETLNQTQTTEQ
jgi:hypothetical protein